MACGKILFQMMRTLFLKDRSEVTENINFHIERDLKRIVFAIKRTVMAN